MKRNAIVLSLLATLLTALLILSGCGQTAQNTTESISPLNTDLISTANTAATSNIITSANILVSPNIIVSDNVIHTPSISITANIVVTENLTILRSTWYTTIEPINKLTFGFVWLYIEGTTKADQLTVETHGDGVLYDMPVTINVNKTFSKELCIQFTHSAYSGLTQYSTVVKAKMSDGSYITKNLTSPMLSYLP